MFAPCESLGSLRRQLEHKCVTYSEADRSCDNFELHAVALTASQKYLLPHDAHDLRSEIRSSTVNRQLLGPDVPLAFICHCTSGIWSGGVFVSSRCVAVSSWTPNALLYMWEWQNCMHIYLDHCTLSAVHVSLVPLWAHSCLAICQSRAWPVYRWGSRNRTQCHQVYIGRVRQTIISSSCKDFLFQRHTRTQQENVRHREGECTSSGLPSTKFREMLFLACQQWLLVVK